MLLRSNPSPFLLFKDPAVPRRNPSFLILRKRRRRRRPETRIQASLDSLFSRLVSPNLLDILSPTLGFIAGAAVFLTSNGLSRSTKVVVDAGDDDVIGDWILFTSPTPFNRCVLLRCPSVSFEEGSELLDGVNERLVKEERHYVNLSRGRIPIAREKEEDERPEDEISYQRVCLGTEDGGVISLDWPDNLDLRKEHGMDTTVVIVPGTVEGSMERNIRVFVLDVLKHGYFPVVMNPRGCAGSPLTTARLFTAADSDDVRTAIQFVNGLRPWTTLMSIAWGYGANMLTKYLAEVGESTPLTAAVCIDNPFDLEEATRSFPHHIALDEKLTSGLIDILRTNKEIFQGKSKGFDVQKALSATSVREFDGAISMISYGCDAVEDFYAKNSTKQSVETLKIPVLFIQSDDGTVPPLSVPRSLIAENPFTSLLLCSCLPSTIIRTERSTGLWCQHIATEWLSAVELALLKGRHPLLKDVDVTINPSKGPAFIDDRSSQRRISDRKKIRESYDLDQLPLNHNIADGNSLLMFDRVNEFFIDPDFNVDPISQNKEKNQLEQVTDLDGVSGDDDVEKKQDSAIDTEGSHVLQTAVVVMNMLDITTPGTLDDERKKKVLSAMEQGETLMKALQGAVPEDVRGKLTTAVSDILQNKQTNLRLGALTRTDWTNVTSEVKTRIQEKIKGPSNPENAYSDANSSDQTKAGADSDERLHNDTKSISNNVNIQENVEYYQGKTSQISEYVETASEMESKQTQPSKFEKVSSVISDIEQQRVDQGHGIAEKHNPDDQMVVNDANGALKDEIKKVDSEPERSMQVQPSNSGEAISTGLSTSDNQLVEKEGNGIQKNEKKATENIVDQSVENSPKVEEPSSQHSSSNIQSTSISVTQALDALTGFDDSTQMAVNSVFGVLENMIDQLEKKNDIGNDENSNNNEDQENPNASSDKTINEIGSDEIGDRQNRSHTESNKIPSSPQTDNDTHKKDILSAKNTEDSSGEEKVASSIMSTAKGKISCFPDNNAGYNNLELNILNKVGCAQNFSINPYWNTPHAIYPSTQLPMEQPGLSSTTDLFLDPEEGKWKMVDQTRSVNNDIHASEKNHVIYEEIQTTYSSPQLDDMVQIIEPSYIILDADFSKINPQFAEECSAVGHQFKQDDSMKQKLMLMIKDELLNALKVEVGRRLGITGLKKVDSGLANDMEQLVNTVSENVVLSSELYPSSFSESNDLALVKFGKIEGESMIKMIDSAVQETSHLRKVLPIGVIVGIVLVSLRNYFHIGDQLDHDQRIESHKNGHTQDNILIQESDKRDENCLDEEHHHGRKNNITSSGDKQLDTAGSSNDGIMVGAVTAALSASALLASHQKMQENDEIMANPSASFNQKGDVQGEAMQEKNQNSLMSSLAEKAMSVASPVVPTKDDGEVDHDRLVAVLAELGQKGGILRLVGKIALLWGGIRGAMSLTDRLISFLHIAERPLLQRILAFACMVLVLWSPFVIPLLPSLVQSWTTKSSIGFIGYACIIGLYASVTILVVLWGKRIRGYDNPLEQYGLDLTSAPRVHDFLKGLVGGSMVVLCIHSIDNLLGYAFLSWPSGLPPFSAGPIPLIKTYGNILVLVVRGIVTATGISLVEELLFRSWLPGEIAVDLGYYRAIVISGIAFSLIHRSLPSVPGLLLLSLVLSGIKQIAHGKLAAPVGMRTGIMTTSYILQAGGFIKYSPNISFWLTSTHPLHPFDGAVGLSFCILLAIIFFPQRPPQKNTS
ncbi:uncharacterized protein [Typha latifolia]|uniref:uncharacterized protein isoform X1 n=2 Tax=Typha latifolia TaxID=4733 RepID=UPI003C2FBA56